jgi:hypothetical protein
MPTTCGKLLITSLPHVVGIVAQTHVSGARLVIRSLPNVVGIVAQTNVSGAMLVIRSLTSDHKPSTTDMDLCYNAHYMW